MRNAFRMDLPLNKKTASRLKVGMPVELTGTIITARDRAHKFLLGDGVPAELKRLLKGSLIYHCGPVVRRKGKSYSVLSAGPTTSARFGMYAKALAKRHGIAAFMGKGGMQNTGVPYLSAIGGTGALLAQHITKVRAVYKLREFGMADAIWVFEVSMFPAIVTIDSGGKSLHERVIKGSKKMYKEAMPDGC